jgi:NAD(P)-dependent dehydrogenase (short-subunit alcohol dehydrogenase family)
VAPNGFSIFDLTGRGIAITGGGGHLGAAMVLAVAQSGGTVVACGRHEAALRSVAQKAMESGAPGHVIPMVADVSTDVGLCSVLNRLDDEVGCIDGWVNNAYSGDGGRLLEVDRQTASDTVEAALTDVLMAVQSVAKRMPRGGSIVNISSMYGIVSPVPAVYRDRPAFHSPAAYGAAKAGVLQLTRYAACELGAVGIRVNAISPGPFPSPPVAAEAPDFTHQLVALVPLGRTGKPEDIAGAVVFLLSDASAYVTGHNLVVDGGWTAW